MTVTGTPTVGQTLTGETFAGAHLAWLSCATAQSSCTEINESQVSLLLTSATPYVRFELGGSSPPSGTATGISAALQVQPASTSTSTTSTSSTTSTTSTSSTTTTGAPGSLTVSRFDQQTIGPELVHAQCANTGTPSMQPRSRGTLTYLTGPQSNGLSVGDGAASALITLPATPAYPLTACGFETALTPIALGTDGYYGLMIEAPAGFSIANSTHSVQIDEFHFQNVFGAPINWEVLQNHITLGIHSGACTNHALPNPTCAYRSNADASSGPNLPGYYVIPPGSFQGGEWFEIAMHVHWASDTTGVVQTYWRAKGGTWQQSSNVTGIPTVQYDSTRGCCYANAEDQPEAYAARLATPLAIGLDDISSGSSLVAVQQSMP